MASQIAWPEAPRALKASQCCFNGCNDSVATQLETRPLCLDHFLSVSVQEMDARSACLKANPVDTAIVAGLRNFLADCVRQAETLADGGEFATGAYGDRLAGIVRRSSQLSRSLRRSPRVPSSVPVWLRREDPRHTWEEETWTSTVSRHGAGFVCRHSVEVNGHVVLCRRDKGKRVEARVVYSRFDAEGMRHIGVELLGRDDFWDAAEPDPSDLTNHPGQ
jgi:PilZ domain-containing protein